MRTTVISWLLALAALVGPPVWVIYWFGEGHGASLSRLAQVQDGMSREQVAKLLGNPSTINRSTDDRESWSYGGWTWCRVKVYLKSGVVDGTDHDH